MVSIHGPDDSEFDFRTAMNIWGKLRKRHTGILVEKAKESTEKSKLLKKIVMKSLLLRKITRERIKRDAYLSATAKKFKHTIKVSNKKHPPITEQKWRTL